MAAANQCKYAYWVEEKEAGRLKDALAADGRSVIDSAKAVCVPMSKRIDIGIVPPATWKNVELCKRPLSWYWVSKRAGQYLIVSSGDLTSYGLASPIVLQPIKFRPSRMPDEKEKAHLVSRPSYQSAKPPNWDHLDAAEKARQDAWMKSVGMRGKSVEALFLTHCANHANFIEPEFFVCRDHNQIPYSIGKTVEVCSACLEFFNILGDAHRVKYVVPCPGAVLYAGLPVNRYVEVTTHLS